jgi:tight adherence protein C
MSSLWLGFGLIATFLSVALGAVAVQSIRADRRRGLEMLQSQVVEFGDLRQQQMAEPFLERVLLPAGSKLGEFAKRITPIGMRERIAKQLLLAGDASARNPDVMAAMRVFGMVGGGVIGLVLAKLAGLPNLWTLLAGGFGSAMLFLLLRGGLSQQALNRQEAIRRALPDTLDLLTISVEAGLGFDAALAHVRKKVPGALSDEIGRTLKELQLGVSRKEALRNLAGRNDVDELTGLVMAMVQADEFGVSVAKVLRAQSRELRIRRRQRAEEMAMKVPVKLLVPLIAGFLPAIFVTIAGPGIIRLVRAFSGQNFGF